MEVHVDPTKNIVGLQDYHVLIVEALNLMGKDIDNKSTPFVKV
jgi:hypothetical protein